MNIDKKTKTYSLIAGISFILLVVGQYVIFPLYFGLSLSNFAASVFFTVMGVIHLLGKTGKIRLRILSVISIIIALYIIPNLLLFLSMDKPKDMISKLMFLYATEISRISAYVILSVIYWVCSSNITEKKMKMISWIIYLPPILYLVWEILTFAVGNLGNFYLSGIFLYVLNPTAFLFSGLWLKNVITNKKDEVTENENR